MPNNNNTAILFSHVTLGYENIVTTPDLNLTSPIGITFA